MGEAHRAAVPADERDEFLGVGGTGVVSFATDGAESPHSVPISYGYDPEKTAFYFRMATGLDSQKGDVVGKRVTFVTYGRPEDADRWVSVIAKGRLESVDTEGISTDTLEGLERVDIPIVDVFDMPVQDISFEFLRLVPDELTARKELRADI
ncbi:pyridoxamine 5'-phosphate oxidase family protein [Halomicroarcula sp. GCM10025324]|uniref:pyridoxamine 5'-phosphate oxidase family protein n=1 Tax=Haloarcula TaxID=2237 RepID=UPI0023E8CCCE|nr:pyridoxamine 5'-phosphate oxidase family protein [Halomicroarcula sp. ZS-22-S1]